MDGNSVEVLVTWTVVRKLVDSPLFLSEVIRSPAGRPPGDVHAHTQQQQHTQHCGVPGHAEVEERG